MIIFSRFFVIQVVQGEKLRYRAIGQWTREIPVVAARGVIEDRNGVVLAENSASYSVFVRPNAVKDKKTAASALAGLFGLDAQELCERLETTKVSELTIARHVEKPLTEELEKYDLPGVYYARDNTRVYPYGQALSRVLGFTSSDNSGLTGLEKYYDKYLAGIDGEIAYPADLVGTEVEGEVMYLPATDGLTVRTTIDYGIQAVAEAALERVYEQYSPVSAQCVVLDPNTFDVLAMAEYPGYDLNDVPRDDPELLNELSRNDLVSDIYEPGSTFKIITAAANIEEYLRGNTSAFSLQHIFNSSRTRSVDGTTIKCWSNHANGKHCNQTLAEALNNSCNPCFTDIALALGKETFYDYLEAFNFGKVTGIDFSGEAQGMLVSESAVRDCDLARIGFGQTVAVTALQLACASAAAVNGGYYYQPRLVSAVYAQDGSVSETIPVVLKNRTVSEEASRMLASLLEGVVANGSGSKAYIEGYKIGGKTGTAQKFENGSIAQGKYVSSFLGFFPSDAPQYLALVIVDEPQGAYYGSVVAAPAAKEIFQGIIDLKDIRPYGGT
ncbi:MAG TPA: hypothetical protein H9729_08130 [Candidatus Borkfalkia excrementigallinarum]|uniref:Penicillin-binding protein 2 n=1 Tax=Candidatus Borkfalkia excrementigallinarum TaxID=2838506 RepID=A0A9D1ZXS4_9FIRM|nr:hypothetical protein [Candidatus Borkfalkia excrementigallinarum]